MGITRTKECEEKGTGAHDDMITANNLIMQTVK